MFVLIVSSWLIVEDRWDGLGGGNFQDSHGYFVNHVQQHDNGATATSTAQAAATYTHCQWLIGMDSSARGGAHKEWELRLKATGVSRPKQRFTVVDLKDVYFVFSWPFWQHAHVLLSFQQISFQYLELVTPNTLSNGWQWHLRLPKCKWLISSALPDIKT